MSERKQKLTDEIDELVSVTDGQMTIPADRLVGGEHYRMQDNGKGEVYLSHIQRQDDDGSRSVLLLEDGYTALQLFCREMGQGVMTHRPEYTLAISGLMIWAMEQEGARQRVQEYGEALYGGKKHGTREGARFIRLLADAVTALNQFASGMSEVLGGMNAERAIILTALTAWAVEQEEAPDVVDDYVVEMYTLRREERKKARAQMKGESLEDSDSKDIVTDDELSLDDEKSESVT